MHNTHWLGSSPFSFEELQGKKVFAAYETRFGTFQDVGEVRVKKNPSGLLAIEFCFTKLIERGVATDFIYFLSGRQVTYIRRRSEIDQTEADFVYELILKSKDQ